MAWPKGRPRPDAFKRKDELSKPVAEIVKEESSVIPESASGATFDGGLISSPAAAEDPAVKIALDKPADSAVLLNQEENVSPIVQENPAASWNVDTETLSPRTKQNLINIRRHMITVIGDIDKDLRKAGVRV